MVTHQRGLGSKKGLMLVLGEKKNSAHYKKREGGRHSYRCSKHAMKKKKHANIFIVQRFPQLLEQGLTGQT